jgi:hypothetical protein
MRGRKTPAPGRSDADTVRVSLLPAARKRLYRPRLDRVPAIRPDHDLASDPVGRREYEAVISISRRNALTTTAGAIAAAVTPVASAKTAQPGTSPNDRQLIELSWQAVEADRSS